MLRSKCQPGRAAVLLAGFLIPMRSSTEREPVNGGSPEQHDQSSLKSEATVHSASSIGTSNKDTVEPGEEEHSDRRCSARRTVKPSDVDYLEHLPSELEFLRELPFAETALDHYPPAYDIEIPCDGQGDSHKPQ